jgi:anti-anti-sigma factor
VNASVLTIDDGAAKLSGDLTFSTAASLYDQMESLTAGDSMPVSIDLRDVKKIDSAGLALLLEWQSAYRKQSGSDGLMEVRNPPTALLKIARLCDAGEFLSDKKRTREKQ